MELGRQKRCSKYKGSGDIYVIPSICPDCRVNEIKQIFDNRWTITYECQNCALRINVNRDLPRTIKLLRTPYHMKNWEDATEDELKIMGDEVVVFT
jgi:hypothetical protein